MVVHRLKFRIEAKSTSVNQELAKVDWSILFADEGISIKWDAFKRVVRIQGMHVPFSVKGKAAGVRNPG